jgi:hypothetical protein
MKIKVRGLLPDKVVDMGVRIGQIYEAEQAPGTVKDAIRFKVIDDEGEAEWCTLRPKNYIKL